MFGCIFVEPDEVPERDGKFHGLRRAEWIKSEVIIELRHQDGEAEGIEARFRERQVVAERAELLVLDRGDLLHFRQYR